MVNKVKRFDGAVAKACLAGAGGQPAREHIMAVARRCDGVRPCRYASLLPRPTRSDGG